MLIGWGLALQFLDHSQQVVAEGVAQVSRQVLNWSLASHIRLDEESEHREHGQPSVLDLLHLQQSELVGVLGKTEGSKAPPG